MSGVGRVAVAVTALLAVLVLTLAVFGLPVLESLRLIATGAFGNWFGVSRTLVKAIPLILTGLGMVVAWRAGMYNIGGEGQFIVGGLLGALFAKLTLGMVPGGVGASGVLLASVVGGALWAWGAGWLYVRRGVEVVISTILLNFVALQLLGWMVSGPLQEPRRQLPLTERLPEAWMLTRFDRQADLHVGIFVAVLAVVAVAFYLFRTTGGFRLRLTGENPSAARANRVQAGRVQLGAMALSGGLCGLAGGIEYVGLAGQLGTTFSQQWGFLAIPVALLGGLNPYGVALSSVYFGALFAGSDQLSRFTAGGSVGSTLIYVIQGLAVLVIVGFAAWRSRRPAVAVEEG